MSDNKKYDSKLTIKGFNDLYDDKLKECETFTQAYHEAEEYHENTFGGPRYSNYNTFWMCRRNFIEKGE